METIISSQQIEEGNMRLLLLFKQPDGCEFAGSHACQELKNHLLLWLEGLEDSEEDM